MSCKKIGLWLKYKDLCIIKHALRDKFRDESEEKVYQEISDIVQQFKEKHHIPDKPYTGSGAG